MAEEIQLLEKYGEEYGIDINNDLLVKIMQKVREIKEVNDIKNEKFKSTLRAIFFITNLEAINKISTSVNEIEKYFICKDCINQRNNNLSDFICSIKHIHPHLEELISKDSLKILSSLIDEYSFSIRVFYKFEGLFDYFFQTQINFTVILKEFMWLLFIQCKCQFLERTRNTLLAIPLLVTIFYMILNDVSEDKLPLSFITDYEKQNLQKSSYLLRLLCSKNLLENFDDIINLKDMIKRDLISKSTNLIKSNNDTSFSGLSVNNLENLTTNVNILKNLYGSRLKIDCFDERLFLVNNMKDNSPVKLTPFKKQGHHNHYFKKPSCYQKLDFSMNMSQTTHDMVVDNNNTSNTSINNSNYFNMLNETVKNSVNNSQFNNSFQSIKFNAPAVKNSYSVSDFYGLTPCSKIIQMDNWIQKYIKDMTPTNLNELLPLINKDISYLNEYFDTVMNKIDNYLNNCKARIKNNRGVMNNLFIKFFNDILWLDIENFTREIACNLLRNNDLILAIIICTVESILFIENVENVSIFKLIEVVKLDLYDLWKIINPFLKVASINMPPPIITHFSEIEVQIISYMIWSNKNKFFNEIEKFNDFTNKGENKGKFYIPNESINTFKKILNVEFSNQTLFVFQKLDTLNVSDLQVDCSNRNINEYQTFNYLYLFLRRILHYCLIFIKRLQQNLNLSGEITVKILTLMKYFIFEETNIFFSRHVDQIMLSSCYLIIKKYKGDMITFSELYTKRYKSIKVGLSELEAKSIVSRVLLKTNTYESLVDFYNKYFITIKGLNNLLNDEIKDNKRKKVLNEVNYVSVLFEDDDFISNPGLKIYVHITRIFQGGDISRLGISASPDITGTPRTNRIKNTYSEKSIAEMDIKKDHKNADDFFRNRAIMAKSSFNSKDTPNKQIVNINEETKNSQSAKSTPEFMKFT